MTSSLNQSVDISSFSKYPWGIYDGITYGGVCGYFKTPEINGKISIFANGKMISVGSKSIQQAKDSLDNAKFHLVQSKLIENLKLKKYVKNIVATLTLDIVLDLNKISKKIASSEYNPERFVGLILKSDDQPSFIIYSSGKIIIAGATSLKNLKNASTFIQSILKKHN